jgi:hypothetical protein
MSIPRETSVIWPLFVLAHFKPFGVTQPLIPPGESCNDLFHTYPFSNRHLEAIKNWNATHECEDERDAERLRKQAAATRESAAMTAAVAFPELNVENIESTLSISANSERDFRIHQEVLAMQQSNWLRVLPKINNADATINDATDTPASILQNNLPDPTPNLMKRWKDETKKQEQAISNRRRNALNPEQQIASITPTNASET